MAKSASAYGHLGLMFGVLGIILMLAALNASVNPYGIGYAAVFFPLIFWVVGVLFVVGELYEASRPA